MEQTSVSCALSGHAGVGARAATAGPDRARAHAAGRGAQGGMEADVASPCSTLVALHQAPFLQLCQQQHPWECQWQWAWAEAWADSVHHPLASQHQLPLFLHRWLPQVSSAAHAVPQQTFTTRILYRILMSLAAAAPFAFPGAIPGFPNMTMAMAAPPSQQATRHARRVYVGGLPPTAHEQSIAQFFSSALAAVGGSSAGPGARTACTEHRCNAVASMSSAPSCRCTPSMCIC